MAISARRFGNSRSDRGAGIPHDRRRSRNSSHQLQRYGGDDGIRVMGLLESAIAMPQQSFDGQYLHVDIFEMAAAYAFHLAESQAFVDGNKRTGLAAAYMFLTLIGYRLVEQGNRLYDAMIAIGTHRMDKGGLAKVLRECSVIDE